MINAALIRELRMMYQHGQVLFGRNQAPRLRARLRAESDNWKCAVCLRSRKPIPKDAVTIANGQAVCRDHLS